MTSTPHRTRSVDFAFGEAEVVRGLGFEAEPVLVAERYELQRRIGSGGFGTVYEARDIELGRQVAVKILDLGDRREAKREGWMLAQLQHPNVVQIFDHGEAEDYRYFVLALLTGPTLREWCSGRAPEEIIAKYIEAGRGLAAAHARGLVHRDFKPSNVRIGAEGQAVVVDFGLARQIDTLEADSGERDRVYGTIAYLAPERLLGESGNECSDQFSFCVALWEALSGRNPFGPCGPSATPRTRCLAIQAGPGGGTIGPSAALRALRRGLAFEPHDRFPTMDALMAALVAKPRRWYREAALSAAVLAVLGLVFAQVLPVGTLYPRFVDPLVVEWSGNHAVVLARKGDSAGSLNVLETAERQARSEADSRVLALASQQVALELERHLLYADAIMAWGLAIRFARDGGAQDLEREYHARIGEAASRAAE